MCTGIEIALLGSVAMSAVGSISAGQAAKKQANTEAAILNQQAARERQQAEADSAEFRGEQQRLMAKRRAILGGSGVDISTGSPLLASEDFAGEAELQALKIINGGEVRGTRLQQQASIVRAKGRSAETASFFSAGASLLKAGSKVKWA
jgi:hypothetical protein